MERVVHRTNNSQEGYWNRLNSGSANKLKFYRLVGVLYDDATHFKAEVTHIQEGHLGQRLSRKTKSINLKLQEAWDQHARGEITDFRMLYDPLNSTKPNTTLKHYLLSKYFIWERPRSQLMTSRKDMNYFL